MKSIRSLAEKEENVIFGGRLGEYKYYDMDAVIAAALEICVKKSYKDLCHIRKEEQET